jgi:hypothetical protein
MKIEMNIERLRGLSLTFLLTLLMQCGAAVWWVSAEARDNEYLEKRVDVVEMVAAKNGAQLGQICERLARIEERLSAQMVLLGRIDKQMAGGK